MQICSGRSCSGSASTASTCIAAATSLREAATTATLQGTASVSVVGWGTTAASHAAALNVRVGSGLDTTLFDNDTLVANLVRVGFHGSLVALCRLEVDESAVL